MELKLTGNKKLVLPSPAIAYILDKLATCPYKDVQQLIADIFNQLKQQEDNDEVLTGTGSPSPSDGVQSTGPADR